MLTQRFMSHITGSNTTPELEFLYMISLPELDSVLSGSDICITDSDSKLFVSARYNIREYSLVNSDLRLRLFEEDHQTYNDNSIITDSITFNSAGTKLLSSSLGTYPYVVMSTLSTPWDLSTITGSVNSSIFNSDFYPYTGLISTMTPDGTGAIFTGINNSYTGLIAVSYDMSPAYDVTSLSENSGAEPLPNSTPPYIGLMSSGDDGFMGNYRINLPVADNTSGITYRNIASVLGITSGAQINGMQVFDSNGKLAVLTIDPNNNRRREIYVYQINY